MSKNEKTTGYGETKGMLKNNKSLQKCNHPRLAEKSDAILSDKLHRAAISSEHLETDL
jgi:hypothetical protein